jgi:hypothetical protein
LGFLGAFDGSAIEEPLVSKGTGAFRFDEEQGGTCADHFEAGGRGEDGRGLDVVGLVAEMDGVGGLVEDGDVAGLGSGGMEIGGDGLGEGVLAGQDLVEGEGAVGRGGQGARGSGGIGLGGGGGEGEGERDTGHGGFLGFAEAVAVFVIEDEAMDAPQGLGREGSDGGAVGGDDDGDGRLGQVKVLGRGGLDLVGALEEVGEGEGAFGVGQRGGKEFGSFELDQMDEVLGEAGFAGGMLGIAVEVLEDGAGDLAGEVVGEAHAGGVVLLEKDGLAGVGGRGGLVAGGQGGTGTLEEGGEAAGEVLADHILAGSEVGKAEMAVGIGEGLVEGFLGIGEEEINGDIGDAGFGGILGTVAIEIMEDHTADGLEELLAEEQGMGDAGYDGDRSQAGGGAEVTGGIEGFDTGGSGGDLGEMEEAIGIGQEVGGSLGMGKFDGHLGDAGFGRTLAAVAVEIIEDPADEPAELGRGRLQDEQAGDLALVMWVIDDSHHGVFTGFVRRGDASFETDADR